MKQGITNNRSLAEGLNGMPKGVAGLTKVSERQPAKLQPQARELEEAVLGALMLDKGAFEAVSELLTDEKFYVDAHRMIYKVCYQLSKERKPIDLLTVAETLHQRKELDMVGGAHYLTRLTNAVVSSANIEHHARIVLDRFIYREIIQLCGAAIGDCYDMTEASFDIADRLIAKLTKLVDGLTVNQMSDMADNSLNFFTQLDKKMANPERVNGVPSGYAHLDECTGGWQKQDLIILAARPAVGKTSLALNLARNAALDAVKPTPVLFFSLEMSKHQLTERLYAAESLVRLVNVRKGKLNGEEVQKLGTAMKVLERAPIYIDDSAGLDWMQLRRKAYNAVNKHKVGLIIIDYLQLMSDIPEAGRNKSREQTVSTISRELKKLAKELDVPIIALSQLTREAEKTGNKRPMLSHLRESGAIEQDADLVAFIWKPEGEENHVGGTTFVDIAKHRNGMLEKIKLVAWLHVQKWLSEDDAYVRANPRMGAVIMEEERSKKLMYATDDFAEGVTKDKYEF